MRNKYAVFLRAVNVSGRNIIKMAELKDMLSQNGFDQVGTYIQSGNIVLTSPMGSEKTALAIRQLIASHFNLVIEVFVLSEDKLLEALHQNPFDSSLPGNRVFATFLNAPPSDEVLVAFNAINLGEEQFKIIGNVAYFYLPQGMANSKLSNNFIENKLKVKSTGRNINTLQKMVNILQGITPIKN